MKYDTVQFKSEITLKLRQPKFKLSKNIPYLDTAKLSKGSHTIELGKFEGCGCDCVVIGKVSRGMLTGINYPKCKEAGPFSADLAKKVQAARKQSSKTAGRKWKDVPVADFISKPAVARIIIDIIVDGDCVMICWNAGAGEQCVICCPGWCIGPSEPVLSPF